MNGFETQEEAINAVVLELVGSKGAKILVHNDGPTGEDYVPHNLENPMACWCGPVVYSLERSSGCATG